MPQRCIALVPCAGVGLRAGQSGPKQYATVAGQAVVAHTLNTLLAVPELHAVLVVLAPDDVQFEAHAPHFAGPRAWVARVGGATRAATVRAGLQVLRERGEAEPTWVLVHDAARCMVQTAWVQRLITGCIANGVGGLLATPLADTLKDSAPDRPKRAGSELSRSHATLPRSGKWLAQTPQMFRLGELAAALHAAATRGLEVTDEASAMEAVGVLPLLVPGALENFKLTYPDDFALAERLFQTR